MSSPPLSHSFVATLIDVELSKKLLHDLQVKGFEITKPPHTQFSAKLKGLSCTLYVSGKLVVQGKNCAEFIEFYLEPEILKSFSFRHASSLPTMKDQIGIDESGKGDFFGPLCIAGVYVTRDQLQTLQALGIKDSKTLSDSKIQKIATSIKKECLYHIVKINPFKYNQIYQDFKNLNRLLAWGHATAIEQLVLQSGCKEVIIDQFADESVVEKALKRKNLEIHLEQRHRAEEVLPVAAASILARQAFIDGLKQLSDEIGIPLPKGASKAVQIAGQEVVRKWGKEKLREISKEHFKTFNEILGKSIP